MAEDPGLVKACWIGVGKLVFVSWILLQDSCECRANVTHEEPKKRRQRPRAETSRQKQREI